MFTSAGSGVRGTWGWVIGISTVATFAAILVEVRSLPVWWPADPPDDLRLRYFAVEPHVVLAGMLVNSCV